MADGKVGILNFRVSTYAYNIYIFGNYSFTKLETDNPTYVTPVYQYAASHFTIDQIQTSLSEGHISFTEFETTVSYMS